MVGEALAVLGIVGTAEGDVFVAAVVAAAGIAATAVSVVGFAVAAEIAEGKIVAVDGYSAIEVVAELEPVSGSYFGRDPVVLYYHYTYPVV